MSEEEKKAIESLRKNRGVSFAQADIISNLIEKQQKEIEELKDKNKELTERVLRLESDKFWDNVISINKIKAKIEELEKEQEDNRKTLYNVINNLCFEKIDKISDRISVNMAVRDILQSLLEEE